MFESIQAPDYPSRFRAIAAIPLLAVVAAEIWLTIAPLVAGGPSWMFKAVEVVLFVAAGDALYRSITLAIAVRRELDASGWLWFAAAVLMSLFCAWQFSVLRFPGRF